MTISKVNPSGWSTGAKLTSVQANAIDTKLITALDKTAAGDTLTGIINKSGAGRIVDNVYSLVSGGLFTFAVANGYNVIRIPSSVNAWFASGVGTLQLSPVGAQVGDQITIYAEPGLATLWGIQTAGAAAGVYSFIVADNFAISSGTPDVADGPSVTMLYTGSAWSPMLRGTRLRSLRKLVMTASGTWTARATGPIKVTCIGGGGGGGGGAYGLPGGRHGGSGGGGGGAVAAIYEGFAVAGDVFGVSIGTAGGGGGAGGAAGIPAATGIAGGVTLFGDVTFSTYLAQSYGASGGTGGIAAAASSSGATYLVPGGSAIPIGSSLTGPRTSLAPLPGDGGPGISGDVLTPTHYGYDGQNAVGSHGAGAGGVGVGVGCGGGGGGASSYLDPTNGIGSKRAGNGGVGGGSGQNGSPGNTPTTGYYGGGGGGGGGGASGFNGGAGAAGHAGVVFIEWSE